MSNNKKRPAAAEDTANGGPKRLKRSVEDELICPITLDLPFDPVTAEDGQVYERSAIEGYFKTKTSAKVKSPVLNKDMGKQLFPALRTKNTIEILIEDGSITGELANKWQEKHQMDELIKKAKDGDRKAMELVAFRHWKGTMGFKLDKEQAFEWFEKARIEGSVRGLLEVGYMLFKGEGVEKDEKRGLIYFTLAAERGADWAAYWLGTSLADGLNGFQTNSNEAIYWLEKSLQCPHKILTEKSIEKAKSMLEELKTRGQQ